MTTKKHEKILTVGELIALLEKMPKDIVVLTEGCDCFGDADNVECKEGIRLEDGKKYNYVLITRSN
jgi:hypothetical protein